MLKKMSMLISAIVCSLLLSGCNTEIQIFEDKDSKNVLKGIEKDELMNGYYYVKEGTKFYKIYELDSSGSGTSLDNKKVAWTTDNEGLIPEYYENELIAQSSVRVNTSENLTLERYKDIGLSLGIYGAYFEDGYIKFTSNSNVIEKTSAADVFQNDVSNNIMIDTINNTKVTEAMLTEAGTLLGMTSGGTFHIGFFAGTTYMEEDVEADTHFYQSYEAYNVDDFQMTKNGYMALSLPSDLKTGLYRLSKNGFFKYYAFKKGEQDISTVDMNEPYYKSEEDQMAAFSQQFTFNLDATTSNMTVHAKFDPTTVTTSSGKVKMMVTSPDKKIITVEADKDDGEINCDMMKSIAGKWTVNITPQSMKVSNVEIKSNETVQQTTREEYEMTFDTDMTGVVITAGYEGEGTVTGQILSDSNESYTMKEDKNSTYGENTKMLSYQFAYLPAGTYKVVIYHYPDTKIVGTNHYLSEDVRDVEIINIE